MIVREDTDTREAHTDADSREEEAETPENNATRDHTRKTHITSEDQKVYEAPASYLQLLSSASSSALLTRSIDFSPSPIFSV